MRAYGRSVVAGDGVLCGSAHERTGALVGVGQKRGRGAVAAPGLRAGGLRPPDWGSGAAAGGARAKGLAL